MPQPPNANPQLTARKRGARTVAIALVLLLLAVLLLAGFAPAVGGRYPLVIRLAAYALTGAGWGGLMVGLHGVIVGPGVGPLAAPLRLIAIAVVVGGVGLGLVGAWAVHAIVSEPRPASHGHHHDWD
ncbi:MAG: hypothetical protein JNK64_24075 [Myxococcales bacterium]|nr:hypothetical protein [Myxococcales bacterium]